MKKKIFVVLTLLSVIGGSYHYWHKHLNYNFGAVTSGKVYKSGVIKPQDIESYTSEYGIKTVIDLRNEVTLYPPEQVKAAIDKIESVNYVNIRSSQVPSQDNLRQFFEIMDNQDNYPVLIHCYHGLGRTMLYVALYRIEYEGFSNEDARSMTRFIVESPLYDSSFASGKNKGDYLINYQSRELEKLVNIKQMID